MIKNKYTTIKDLVTGKNFDFFNNFEDQGQFALMMLGMIGMIV